MTTWTTWMKQTKRGGCGNGRMSARIAVGRRRAMGFGAALALVAACGEADGLCSPEDGALCLFMGTGVAGLGAEGLPATKTELYLVQDLTFSDDNVYVLDWNNHRIRAMKEGLVYTVVGTGYLGDASEGPATEVALNHPTHVSVSPTGKVIISAWHNSKILAFDPMTGWLEPICGTGMRGFAGDGGPAHDAVLDLPTATAFTPDGGMYITDQASQRLRFVATDGTIRTALGDGTPGYTGDGGPATLARISLPGGQSAPPAGRIAADLAGNIYLADSGNHVVRRIDVGGTITTIAGSGVAGYGGDGGPATSAQLARPNDVAVAADGTIYIADTDNACVRAVDPGGEIRTVAGICGEYDLGAPGHPATSVHLDRPYGVALDPGGLLYIADTHNHRIVYLDPNAS